MDFKNQTSSKDQPKGSKKITKSKKKISPEDSKNPEINNPIDEKSWMKKPKHMDLQVLNLLVDKFGCIVSEMMMDDKKLDAEVKTRAYILFLPNLCITSRLDEVKKLLKSSQEINFCAFLIRYLIGLCQTLPDAKYIIFELKVLPIVIQIMFANDSELYEYDIINLLIEL